MEADRTERHNLIDEEPEAGQEVDRRVGSVGQAGRRRPVDRPRAQRLRRRNRPPGEKKPTAPKTHPRQAEERSRQRRNASMPRSSIQSIACGLARRMQYERMPISRHELVAARSSPRIPARTRCRAGTPASCPTRRSSRCEAGRCSIGPGLVAAGAAIGGGEWLAGPLTTARYGGAILWLATVSILAQVIYNLEICRYTLYCGEPIFTGKFRLLPGPMFWLVVYLFLDFGSVFPYLVANAATPLGAVILGEIPDVDQDVSRARHRTCTGKTLLCDPDVRRLPAGARAAHLRRQSVQLAQGDHDVQDRRRVRLSAAGRRFCIRRRQRGSRSLSGFFKFGSVPVLERRPTAPPRHRQRLRRLVARPRRCRRSTSA